MSFLIQCYFNFLLTDFASLSNLKILDLSDNDLNGSLQNQGTYVMLSLFHRD